MTRGRVAVDLTAPLGTGDLGPESVPIRFVEALAQHVPDVEFVIVSRAARHAGARPTRASNLRHMVVPEPGRAQRMWSRLVGRARRSRYSRWASALPAWRDRRLAKIDADLVLCPFTLSGLAAGSTPVVVAVRDLQHISSPFLLSAAERRSRAQGYEITWVRASRLVCTTASVRETALRASRLPRESAITLALAPLLVGTPSEVGSAMGMPARNRLRSGGYLLVSGDFEARHNHRVLLTALGMHRATHPECDLRLVCAGTPGPGMATLQRAAEVMGLANALTFASSPTLDEFADLLQNCLALVAPWLYETVGEAVLQAMKFGRPILHSGTADLVELVGSRDGAFDPRTPATLVAALERIERDTSWLGHLAQLARERALSFDEPHTVAHAFADAILVAAAAPR